MAMAAAVAVALVLTFAFTRTREEKKRDRQDAACRWVDLVGRGAADYLRGRGVAFRVSQFV